MFYNAVTATDPAGRELWTWEYPLKPQAAYAPSGKPVKAKLTNGELLLKAAEANTNLVGIAFDYPEDKMVKKTGPGNGPCRVWRNRLAGVSFGVWETAYNQTQTGWKDWVYPEYGGYFSGVRWTRLTIKEGVVTPMVPDEIKFVRVGMPVFPDENPMAKMAMVFPDGNLAVPVDIPAMGTKFQKPAQTGPQGAPPLVDKPYEGTAYLRFESDGSK